MTLKYNVIVLFYNFFDEARNFSFWAISQVTSFINNWILVRISYILVIRYYKYVTLYLLITVKNTHFNSRYAIRSPNNKPKRGNKENFSTKILTDFHGINRVSLSISGYHRNFMRKSFRASWLASPHIITKKPI